MAIASGDEQIARARGQRRGRRSVRVRQRPQEAEETGFRPTLFAINHQNRIRAVRLQGGQQESDGEGEVVVGQVRKKLSQVIDRPAAFRIRQGSRVRRAAKPHWRVFADSPAGCGDPDGAPLGVAKIDEKMVAVAGDAHVDFALDRR